jgi:hypothetical protein
MRHFGIADGAQPSRIIRASLYSCLCYLTVLGVAAGGGSTPLPANAEPVPVARATSATPEAPPSPSGQRALFKTTNSPTIRMPNSYTLEIDDPQYGKLSY